MLAKTPHPPYYAVIFSSVRTSEDDGYSAMAQQMLELASQQDGYLGVESAKNSAGITVSYWENLESIRRWKMNADHQLAQEYGRTKWYKAFKVRVARVEYDYEFDR